MQLFSQTQVTVTKDSSATIEYLSLEDSIYYEGYVTYVKDSIVKEVETLKYGQEKRLYGMEREKYNIFGNIELELEYVRLNNTFYITDSIIYNYNAEGKLAERARWRFGDTQTMEGRFRKVYDYNDSGLLSANTNYNWNIELWDWEGTFKNEFAYTAKGLDSIRTEYQWNSEEKDWEMVRKLRFINEQDDQKRLVRSTAYNLNEDSIQYNRRELTYDEYGNVTRRESYYWDSEKTEWKGELRSDSLYDATGKILQYSIFTWNSSLGDWMGNNKYTVNYDENGRINQRTMYFINTKTLDWDTIVRTDFFYHQNGSKRLNAISLYDESIKEWKRWKHIWYNTGDKYWNLFDTICSGEQFYWHEMQLSEPGSYEDINKSFNGSDSSYYLQLEVNPKPESFPIMGSTETMPGLVNEYSIDTEDGVNYVWKVVNGVLESNTEQGQVEVRWDQEGNAFLSAYGINEYGCLSDTASLLVQVGLNDVYLSTEDQIIIYPIPARNVLNIQSGLPDIRLELLRIDGTMVLNTSDRNVDLSSLKAGMYIARILNPSGEIILCRKIIKKL
jgi:hypothetical protein